MKKTILIPLALVVSSLVCWGQTNSHISTLDTSSAANSGALIKTPKAMVIRSPSKMPRILMQGNNRKFSPRQTTVFTDPLGSDWNPAHISSFSRVDGEQVLAPQAPVYPESKVPRSLRPKIVHASHVQIYSPIVTAIARKNPLDLFDSTALSISF